MVRTRIAPSPTGQDVHVGTVATALINWAWAKKNRGKFIIRIEDTDRSRLVPGGEERMLATLEKLGLIADESPQINGPYGPYRQSERLEIYKRYASELVKIGAAYYCICSKERLEKLRLERQKQKLIPKYDKYCLSRQEEVNRRIADGTPYVIRMNVPLDKEIVCHDVVRGDVNFNTSNIDDSILLKSDGFPTYHLAVVVDDHLMQISHVIRAEEWLPSTPKHILLYQAFGWHLPVFAHLSLLRNPDRSKLSKRKNPVWASEYLATGILPEAFLNYLALMGWSHPKEREIFSLEEYIELFDLKDILKTAPVFDPVKLEWLNGEYIRRYSPTKLKDLIVNFYQGEKKINLPTSIVERSLPLIQERIKKLADYYPLCQFLFEKPHNYELDLHNNKELLKKIYKRLRSLTDWNAERIGKEMVDVAKETGLKKGDFFMILRVAITGKKISPPLNESMELLGKKRCLDYLSSAIDLSS